MNNQELFEYNFEAQAIFYRDQYLIEEEVREWRDADQLSAILSVVKDRKKLLLVQRTGWGKSLVYFIATKILRDEQYYQNANLDFQPGPALMISPLLALIRNQVLQGQNLLQIESIDSTTTEGEKEKIIEGYQDNKIDLLIITPEQLTKPFFQENIAPEANKIPLLIIDEAHCISQWGHDFRPDYMRIKRFLEGLTSNAPVIATTATANNRVVQDIEEQLGSNKETIRGRLARDSLKLDARKIPSHITRYAYLVAQIKKMESSGIVYVSTLNEAKRVSKWLKDNDIDSFLYTGSVSNEKREEIENKFLQDEIDVVVATSALSMGFDKPNLGFVIHFNTPQSPVHYYQEVGRAGRKLEVAFGICLYGSEDDEIVNYFINKAFPTELELRLVLEALDRSEKPKTVSQLTWSANLGKGRIESILKILAALPQSPVHFEAGKGWTRTVNEARINWTQVREIEELRKKEWQMMQEYVEGKKCFMQFLEEALNDPEPKPCGRCTFCLGQEEFEPLESLLIKATEFLKRTNLPIRPRRRWTKPDFDSWQDFIGHISNYKVEEGRALCSYQDQLYGKRVREGKRKGEFDDSLVEASLEILTNQEKWPHEVEFDSVMCVPSLNNPDLVPNFAKSIAEALGIDFIHAIKKIKPNQPQKIKENTAYQKRNLDGIFKVEDSFIRHNKSVLLIDDIVNSRWTITVVGALLRKAGSGPVFPFVLASRGRN